MSEGKTARPEQKFNLQHSDPMTYDERLLEDERTMAWYRKNYPERKGMRVWMESTYCGTWCGSYRSEREGNFSGSSRYRLVGTL